jgi:regulator of protease activity HflC (stomatin/prohibitin superfamily)
VLAIQLAIAIAVTFALLVLVAKVAPRKAVVQEAHVALLYRDGRFVRVLEPGGHWVAGARHRWTEVDLRRRIVTVPGQEVLTRDEVGVKVSVAVRCAVTDPVRAMHAVQSYEDALHLAVQLALRDAVAARSADELLEQRDALCRAIHDRVAAGAPAFGVAVDGVDIKDVMFPAELRRAFTEVLRARKEGQAALEKARGEAAALRSLTNASQLVARHPHLLELRVLGTLEAASRSTGNTLVLGVPQPLINAGAQRSERAQKWPKARTP